MEVESLLQCFGSVYPVKELSGTDPTIGRKPRSEGIRLLPGECLSNRLLYRQLSLPLLRSSQEKNYSDRPSGRVFARLLTMLLLKNSIRKKLRDSGGKHPDVLHRQPAKEGVHVHHIHLPTKRHTYYTTKHNKP